MPTVRAFLAFSLLAAGSVFAGEDMPADLRAYREEIKAAGIKTDETGKVTGRGYTARFCPRPGMSDEARAELRKQMEEMNAKVEREMERLKPLETLQQDLAAYSGIKSFAPLPDLR